MGRSSIDQTNFLGGEWSKAAQGRADLPNYKTAMDVCRNHIPIEEGALPRRPGTAFIAPAEGGGYARLQPFVNSNALPLAVEFTNGKIRFVHGNFFLMDNDSATPIHITANDSAGNFTVNSITSPYTLAVGNELSLWFASGAGAAVMGGYQNQILTVASVADVTHLVLTDANGNPVTPASPVFVGAAVRRITRLTNSIYTTQAQIDGVRIIQAEDAGVCVNGLQKPQLLEECPTFAISDVAFVDGPYNRTAQTMSATVSAYSGAITLTAGSAAFATTDTSGSGGSGTFNRHVRLFTQPAAWNSGTGYTYGQTVTDTAGNWWTSVYSGTNTNHIPGTAPPVISGISTVMWSPSATAGQWAWGTITAYTSTTIVTVTLITGLSTLNGMTIAAGDWYLGKYSDTTAYPACGTYHEGRLWLSGAVANEFDSSNSNLPYTFSPTDAFGVVADNHSISYALNSKQTNQIYWMLAEQQGIVCGTRGGEWLIQASALGDPLTPTSVQAHQVTSYGSANVEPRRAGMAIAFVHRYQQRILEYLADAFSGRFSGRHLNDYAKHLATSGVAEIAYQEELTPIIWCRMTDGSLTGVTYRRVSRFVTEPPVFAGWHRHDSGTSFSVTSICAIPQPDGLGDRLYLITKRPGQDYWIEMLTPIFMETDTL